MPPLPTHNHRALHGLGFGVSMKISIELEIQPDEVGLASELLRTLRLLTEHVKLTHAPTQMGSASVSTAAAGPPAASAAAPPILPVAPVAAAPAVAAPQQPLPAFHASISNMKELMGGLVAQLGDPARHDQIVFDLRALIANPAAGGPDRVLEEFKEAFERTVLGTPEVMASPSGVVPYMEALPKLPEEMRNKAREWVVQKVLTHLAKKRPVTVDRVQFFAHADAFAALVKLGFVQVDGAVQTMERLLMKPDTRSAAVTMLGKSVEYCSEMLLQRTTPGYLAALWRALDKVTEDNFQYDKNYITETLSKTAPPGGLPGTAAAPTPPTAAPAPAASASPTAGPTAVAGPSPTVITPIASLEGHTGTIFALAYNPQRQQLCSASKDCTVRVWGLDGSQQGRLETPNHYCCSLDTSARSGMLLLCCGCAADGVPDPGSLHYAAYMPTNDPAQPWAKQGHLALPDRSMLTSVRFLEPNSDIFVTGETFAAPGSAHKQELVCVYDPGHGSFDTMAPIAAYAEHEQVVTTLCPWPSNPNIFVSGSTDATIRIWDRRVAAHSVGMFGTLDSATNYARAHGDTITCVDVMGDLLVSTAVDGYMLVWDFRAIGNTQVAAGQPVPVIEPVVRMQVDGQPVLKAAAFGSPLANFAAVSTFQGLYGVDISNMAAPSVVTTSPLPDGRPFKPYHDLKWAIGQPMLYGASEGHIIDVFALQ